MAVFYKIVKWVKNGVLMIIHIYAKVSNLKCSIMPAVLATGSINPSALSLAGIQHQKYIRIQIAADELL